MEKLNWTKAVGFGALIWGVMLVVVSLLVSYGVYDFYISKIAVVLASGVLSYLFTRNVRPQTVSLALGYGASWAVTGIILDLIISTQFDSGTFMAWEYWLSYAVILLIPIFTPGMEELDTGMRASQTQKSST